MSAKKMIAPKGFSLIEMAIVLFVVALLLGGLLPTISGQLEAQRRADTRKQLDEIQQALLGYAITQNHLPCPAISSTIGTEDRNIATGACNKRLGFLPWTDLGVQKSDSWGRLFTYSATNAFTNSIAQFTLNATSDITIKTRDASGTLINLSNASAIPAAVLSHGPNGLFGTSENGTVLTNTAPGSSNVDDQSNNATGTSTGKTFVNRDPAGPGNAADVAFDDMIIALSPNILFNRMVTAGKLP